MLVAKFLLNFFSSPNFSLLVPAPTNGVLSTPVSRVYFACRVVLCYKLRILDAGIWLHIRSKLCRVFVIAVRQLHSIEKSIC